MDQVVTAISPAVCDPQSEESLDTLIGLAASSADWFRRDARYILDKVDRLKAAGTWPRRLEGEPRTWERFCREVLGYESGVIEHIREGLALLESDGEKEVTCGQALSAGERIRAAAQATTGEVRPEGQPRELTNLVSSTRSERASRNEVSRATQQKLDTLAREFPDLLRLVRAGELSVNAAWITAGKEVRKVQIPLDPAKAAAAILRHFDDDEATEIYNILRRELFKGETV